MDDDEVRPALYCRVCRQPAQYDDAGELLTCCGVIHMTSDKPASRGAKPYRLSENDRIFLRCQRIDPEV